MAKIPAVCNNCGKLFPSGFNFSGRDNIFVNCTAGPCPYCGSNGKIPNGIYSALSDTALAFVSGKIKATQLKHFIEIIKLAKKQDIDSATLSEEIKNQIPELSSVANILPKTRTELYAFLLVLIAFLTLLLNSIKPKKLSEPILEQEINVIIENTINNYYTQNSPIKNQMKEKKKNNDKAKKKKKRLIIKSSKRRNR